MMPIIHHRSAFLILSTASMMLLVGLLMFVIPSPARGEGPQPGPPEEPTGPVPGRSIRKFKPGILPKLLPRQSAPAAPPLSTTIEGINFDEDATNSGYYHIPPDPIGAAGPNHVLSVVNTSLEWHTKAGSQQNSQRLGHNGTTAVGSFFQTLSPVNGLFDPKVIYDQYNNRFLVVALESTDTADGDPSNTSRILIAVSDDSDPNGTWYFHAINSLINISGSDSWADYPGFAIDNQAIYVTANMYTFGGSPAYQGARLWIINKTPFYTGGAASVNVYDPSSAVGQAATTAQPAHMFGTPSSGVGTFLVRYSGYSAATIEYLSVIRVDNPLTSPSFSHQFISLGNIDFTPTAIPDAPQPMTTTLIETNDRRALHAVWRNNSLWASTTVLPPSGSDAGQATAYWVRVNTSNLASLTVADQGNAGGNDIDAGAYTYFPSIVVDQFGNMALGFALSSPNHYPGAYFTGRFSTDPPGTVQSTSVLAAGQGVYKRTFGYPSNRWGDYSGISLDPSDGKTIWIFNEYALTPGTIFLGESGRWGTRFGSFSFYSNTLFLPLILK